MMDSTRYDVIFGGIKPDQSPEQVKQRLAVALRAPPERIERLFARLPVRIRSGLDETAARRWRDLIRRAGGVCRIEPSTPPAADQPSPGTIPAGTEPLARPVLARCPKCGYAATSAADPLLTAFDGLGECPVCGVVRAKYQPPAPAAETIPLPSGQPSCNPPGGHAWRISGWALGLLLAGGLLLTLPLLLIEPPPARTASATPAETPGEPRARAAVPKPDPPWRAALLSLRQRHGAALTAAGVAAYQYHAGVAGMLDTSAISDANELLPAELRIDPWGVAYRVTMSRNWQPILISAGPNRQFDPLLPGADDILIAGATLVSLDDPLEQLFALATSETAEPLLAGEDIESLLEALLNSADPDISARTRAWLTEHDYIILPGVRRDD